MIFTLTPDQVSYLLFAGFAVYGMVSAVDSISFLIGDIVAGIVNLFRAKTPDESPHEEVSI